MKQKKRFGEIVSPWIVKLAKEAGFEIEGYKHKITEDFERHVLKQHGNEGIESARGQIAVTQEDLQNIDNIMNAPDIAVAGIFKNGSPRIILVKNTEHGSILVEEILGGKRNKALNAKTFWIVRKTVDAKRIKEILKNTRGYDISKIKIATATDANSALYSAQSAEGGGNLHRHGSQQAKKSECHSL